MHIVSPVTTAGYVLRLRLEETQRAPWDCTERAAAPQPAKGGGPHRVGWLVG